MRCKRLRQQKWVVEHLRANVRKIETALREASAILREEESRLEELSAAALEVPLPYQ
jgi:hypothetical protein